MVTREIRTNRQGIVCDVCRRTLLPGEQAEWYLAGVERRRVCDLCAERAQQVGWVRESDADDLAPRNGRHERRTRFVDRLRARRERAREDSDVPESLGYDTPQRARVTPPPEPVAAREPRAARQVHAVPTDDGLKIERAFELFNRSEHVRTVGGVGRSLGAPTVSARPLAGHPGVVAIAVVWELSWYRFEVDLSNAAGGVVRTGHGAEVAELDPDECDANATADERGKLRVLDA